MRLIFILHKLFFDSLLPLVLLQMVASYLDILLLTYADHVTTFYSQCYLTLILSPSILTPVWCVLFPCNNSLLIIPSDTNDNDDDDNDDDDDEDVEFGERGLQLLL